MRGVLRSELGWLLVVAIVGRLLLGDWTFELHADAPWGLVPAVVFCSALLLLVGAAFESGARRALRRIRERRP